jgi:uncharacterized protein YraI
MKKKTRKAAHKPSIYLFLIIALMSTALILSACSSGETVEPTSEPSTGETPTAVAILPTAEPGNPTLTANQNVNMRSGPGTNYPVLALFSGGTQAALVGISPDGTYYAIDLPVATSGSGWVDANYASVTNADDLPVIQPPPVPPTTEFVGPQPGDPTVTANDTVYVRTGPGNDYPAYGIAQAGDKGLVFGISVDGEWYTVRLNPEVVGKGHGWVEAQFVTAENVGELATIEAPPKQTSIDPSPPESGEAVATATDYVNVRSGPGLDYPVLGVGAPGASAPVTGKSEDGQWWQIAISIEYSPDGHAWVNAGYVTTANTENVPVVEAPPPPSVPDTQPPAGAYPCVLVSQSPVDGTTMSPGNSFDMVWQVVNTGKDEWKQGEAKLQYVSAVNGVRLSDTDSVDLPSTIAYGESFQITVKMKAPDSAGPYGETWAIVQGTTTLCPVYNIINVQ